MGALKDKISKKTTFKARTDKTDDLEELKD